jgi:uncharacterized membrane protein
MATSPARVQGIDVARGLASAIMIQGHAYDGWVRDEDKTSASYLFTRVLGTLPLPSFLLLAGAAIALRIEAADAKGESPAIVRTALVRRGLTVFVIGYVVNAVSALMDGYTGPETFFRADVLHAIGLSIVLIGSLGVGGRERIDRRRLVVAASAISIVPLVICPPLSSSCWSTPPPASYLLGVVSYVAPVTRMPVVPLAAWAGMGLLLSLALIEANRQARAIAGAPTHVLGAVLVGATIVAIVGTWAESAMTEALGVPLDQRSWAVVANAIELGGRGVIVLAVGALVTPLLPEGVRAVLTRLGRGSLVAYVIHVPFCYGLLARPIAGRLDMLEATLFVVALEVLSFGAVVLRDVLQEALERRRAVA